VRTYIWGLTKRADSFQTFIKLNFGRDGTEEENKRGGEGRGQIHMKNTKQ
jgi:hypothetical protein